MNLPNHEEDPLEDEDEDDARALFCRYKYIPEEMISSEEIRALLFNEVELGNLHFFWKPEFPSSVCVLIRSVSAVEENDSTAMKKWAKDLLNSFLNSNEDIADMLDRREAIAVSRRRA